MLSMAEDKLKLATKDQSVSKHNMEFFYDLAQLYFKQDKRQEASTFLRKILAIDYHYKDALQLRDQATKTEVAENSINFSSTVAMPQGQSNNAENASDY